MDVIQYLLRGDFVSRRKDKRGSPQKHIFRMALVASAIKDVLQIPIQIAFIASIEEDDGWEITDTMAFTALSIDDAVMKFVFPMFSKLF